MSSPRKTDESAPVPAHAPGRSQQRIRTRRDVLRAAVELLEAGHIPTVAEAADAAGVSRATAYRYFPSQDALLTEAAVQPGRPRAEDLFNRPDTPADVEDRVVLVHEALFDHITAREPQFRHFLRSTLLRGLQAGPAEMSPRPGFRITMLDQALAPLAAELPPADITRLRNALAVLIGTEAIIATSDVLHLDPATAREQLGWACRLLVRAARTEQHPPSP